MLSLAASNYVQAQVNTKAFITSELKALSCTNLCIEKANANAEKNLTNIQTTPPNKTISKWAGVVSGALNAFGGKSESAAKDTANNLVGSDDTSDENNLKLKRQ